MDEKGEIIIYQSENGTTKIEVRLEDENVWLSQQQMAELYQTSRTNVVEHIKHIFEEGELNVETTCRNFRQVRTEGNRNVGREIPFYNLEMIISLGYRVKSRVATRLLTFKTEKNKSFFPRSYKKKCTFAVTRLFAVNA
ncbi:MAG TPA: cell filamentation protein Fic [Porphyromonadaceae bacterium]|nr:cell filamentation protein Fic [Porphyromonadaceae bacterium]